MIALSKKGEAGIVWYKHVLHVCRRASGKQILTAMLILGIAVISVQLFFTNDTFIWGPYDPLTPLSSSAVSRITFLTLGSYLYHKMFYWWLYRIIVKIMRLPYEFYLFIKVGIWAVLFEIVNRIQLTFISLFNASYDLWWNGARFVVFLWPSLIVLFVMFLLFVFIKSTDKSQSNIGHMLP